MATIDGGDIMAEQAPPPKPTSVLYAEAAERSDAAERERDRLKHALRGAQDRYEAAANEEATLWEQLKLEAGNRQERRNGSC